MKRIDHKDFFGIDLPKLEAEFDDQEAFTKCLVSLDRAIREIMKDPTNEGTPLVKPPLAPTYRKKKFHSVLAPHQGVRADMRLVYRYDFSQNILYVFGVGKRKPYAPDDIYKVLSPRNQI